MKGIHARAGPGGGSREGWGQGAVQEMLSPCPPPLGVWDAVLGVWMEERFAGMEAGLTLAEACSDKGHLSRPRTLHVYDPNFK